MAKAYKALPPASELWERFDYKPLTGELVRKHAGKPVASKPNSGGYLNIKIGAVDYGQHRVIWAWLTGQQEFGLIDHRDQNRSNNKCNNLRLATKAQNAVNSRLKKGYHFMKNRSKPWHAQITVDYKAKSLGYFATEAEARAAYEKASKRLHGEFSSV